MAKENKYIMVSLDDNEAKSLAQVLSNDKSREIIRYITENDKCTETQFSEALNIPLSTVHYNIQNLLKAKLIKTLEFHYSEKGKTVLHYSMANKIIVIAPSKEERTNILKRLLASVVTVGVFAGLAGLFFRRSAQAPLAAVRDFSVDNIVLTKSVEVAKEAVVATAPTIAGNGLTAVAQGAANQTLNAAPEAIKFTVSSGMDPLLAFFIGAIIGIAVFVVWEFVIRKRGKD